MISVHPEKMDKKTLDSILDLSKLVFYSNIESSEFLNLRKKCHNYFDRNMLNSCYLLNESNQEIIGACLLLHRRVKALDLEIPSIFLSQVMIHPRYQGKGYFYKLMESVDKFLLANGKSLVLVVARKSVDGLYGLVGYSGFATFSDFYVNLRGNFAQSEDRKLDNMQSEFVEDLLQLQAQVYKNQFLTLVREFDDWMQIIEGQESSNYRIKVLTYKGAIEAYVIFKNSNVIEIASYSESGYLNILGQEFIGEEFTLAIQKSHPALKSLDKYIIGQNHRKVFDGGHLFKFFEEPAKMVGNNVHLFEVIASQQTSPPPYLSLNFDDLEGRILPLDEF